MSGFHALSIADVVRDTRDALLVTFAVPPELHEIYRFIQGQHLTLRATIAGEELRRSYSICASPDEKLRVGIKRVDDGAFSSWAHDNLKRGEVIDVSPPAGHFHTPLDPGAARQYLGFAAGSGITPLLSIIKTTLRTEPYSRFTLVYGNRSTANVMFREELADLKNHYMGRLNLIFIMSREPLEIELFNGRIDREKCDALLENWIRAETIDTAFICGPETMMLAVSEALQGYGLTKSQIKIELFAASHSSQTRAARQASIAQEVHCAASAVIDGRQLDFTVERGESVLDAALRQGFELPYSCKGGVCSTCRTKLVEGEVDMDINYALEDYEIARGFVLACQSFPATAKIKIDYDDIT